MRFNCAIAAFIIGLAAIHVRVLLGGPPTPGELGMPDGPREVHFDSQPVGPSISIPSIAPNQAIAEATRTTFPGETLAATGVGLDKADLRVWLAGHEFTVKPLRAVGDRLFAEVPVVVDGRRLPRSVMLIWPVAEGRPGMPIRINAPQVWWTWPIRWNANSAGQRVRLFGPNLSLTDATPRIWLEPDHGAAAIELPVVRMEPYCLEAQLPRALAAGVYRVWAHNGTGGTFGWSDALTIELSQPPTPPAAVFNVDDYAGDDSQKILAACQAARQHGGGIVRFAARTYHLTGTVHVSGSQPIVLQGAGMGKWDADAARYTGPGTLMVDQTADTRDVVILLSADRLVMRDMTVVSDYAGKNTHHTIRMIGAEQELQRVRVVHRGPSQMPCITVSHPGVTASSITDCELHASRMGVLILYGVDGFRISGTKVFGYFSNGTGTEADAFVHMGGRRFIVEDCIATSHDRTHGKTLSRTCLLYDTGIRECYLAHNRSIDVGPDPSVPGMSGNLGEQYLFHQRGPAGGVYGLLDAGPGWIKLDRSAPPIADVGNQEWVAFIARGKGLGQYRTITHSQDNRIELDRPWRVVPDALSVVIVQRVFRRNIVYANVVDPRPDGADEPRKYKTAGVFLYKGAFNNVVAGNHFNHAGMGVSLAAINEFPNGWNLIRDNIVSNLRGSAGDTAYVPMFYSEHHRGLEPREFPTLDYVTSIGNVFRNNAAAGGQAAAAVGWLRFKEAKDQHYLPSPDRGITLSVIENNEFMGVQRGVLLSAPASWTLLRNNRFGFTTPNGMPIEYHQPLRVPETVEVGSQSIRH